MADRPILFSAPMVCALLEGRKTQTRRIIKPRDHASLFDGSWTDDYVLDPGNAAWRAEELRFAVGDRLWLREAWRCNGWAADVATIFYRASERDGYTAVCEQYPVIDKKPLRVSASWRPSIHMPRWASRLTLIVSDVRVERLQDISEADAKAEGVPEYLEGNTTDEPYCETCSGMGVHGAFGQDYGVTEVDCQECVTAKQKYQSLWNAINGSGAWDANPWVVAVTFEVLKQNIDEVAQIGFSPDTDRDSRLIGGE
ncbi:MAG TPA: hypothetical protein VHP34_11370 [Alphaproteobacteria bacterium]|nr:hypothetical protein [Alphaproteobacteria bacterium]